jgi:hypothetical protein
MKCPSKYDHMSDPYVGPTEFYIKNEKWKGGLSSYTWASSETMTVRYTGNWANGLYWVNTEKMDPRMSFLTDMVSYETYPGGGFVYWNSYLWLKQNNHAANDLNAEGGNAFFYDGSGKWIKYAVGQITPIPAGIFTSTWTNIDGGSIVMYPMEGNAEAGGSTPPWRNNPYYFATPDNGEPQGPRRGVFDH